MKPFDFQKNKFIISLATIVAVIAGFLLNSFFSNSFVVNANASKGHRTIENAKYFSSELKVGDYIHDFGGQIWRVLANERQGILIRLDRAWSEKMQFDDAEGRYRNYQIVATEEIENRSDMGTNFWPESSLRTFLNDEFLNQFDDNQKSSILSLPNSQLLWWGDAVNFYPGSINSYITGWIPPMDLKNFTGSTFYSNIKNNHADSCLQNANTTAYRFTMMDKVFLPDVPIVNDLANVTTAGTNTLSGLRNANGGHYHRVLANGRSAGTQIEEESWMRTPNASHGSSGSSVMYCQTSGNQGTQENSSITLGVDSAIDFKAIAPMMWISPNVTFEKMTEIGGSSNNFNNSVNIDGELVYGFQGGNNYRVFGGLFMPPNEGFGDINVGDYVENFGGIDWRVVNLDSQGIELRADTAIINGPTFDSSKGVEQTFMASDSGSKWFFNNDVTVGGGSSTILGKRKSVGTNNYMMSNMRAWLNNLAPQERLEQFAEQFRPQISTESMPNYKYDGFLSNFSKPEQKVLARRVQRQANWWGDNAEQIEIRSNILMIGQMYFVDNFVRANDILDLTDATNESGIKSTDGASIWGPNESALERGYLSVKGYLMDDLVYLPTILNFGQWHFGTNVLQGSYGINSNAMRNSNGAGYNIVLTNSGKQIAVLTRSAVSSGPTGHNGAYIYGITTNGSFEGQSVDGQGFGIVPMINLSPAANLVLLGDADARPNETRTFKRFKVQIDEVKEQDDFADIDEQGKYLPSGRIGEEYSQLLQKDSTFEVDANGEPLPNGLQIKGDRIVGVPEFDEDNPNIVRMHEVQITRLTGGEKVTRKFLININKGYLNPSNPYGQEGSQDDDFLTASNTDTL
ncbi:MAG: hypothetical protein LBU60_05845, partial [Clostridiales bacterium]|nr:hypothetical protein [Clostridiales bacterium]